MKKNFSGKIRLMLTGAIVVLFVATAFSGVVGDPPRLDKEVATEMEEGPSVQMEDLGYPVRIPDNDWNYWTSPPHMYAIPSGNIGIGTMEPSNKLSIVSGDTDDSILHVGETDDGGLYVTSIYPNHYSISAGAEYRDGQWVACDTSAGIVNSYNGHINFYTNDGLVVGSPFTPTEHMLIDEDGNVGIGTSIPATKLHVQDVDTITRFEDTSIGVSSLSRTMPGLELLMGGMNTGGSKYGYGIKFMSTDPQFTTENPKFLAAITPRATETYASDTDGGMAIDFATTPNDPGSTSVPTVRMTIDKDGDVGLINPANSHYTYNNLLFRHYYASSSSNEDVARIRSYRWSRVDPGSNRNKLIFETAADIDTWNSNQLVLKSNGNVGIGTENPNAKLTVKGDAGENILLNGYNHEGDLIFEIGEGLDYAETFPVSHDEINPGTVVVIDPSNTGNLTISTEAYDRKVAGIVSGAKGLEHGIRLGAALANGYPVALAGRVYCNVDTQYGDIEPGNLLTTSPTPGHAMVVKDYSKAQGAILGKAMEGFSGGLKGQILVLVTLQ